MSMLFVQTFMDLTLAYVELDFQAMAEAARAINK